MSEIDSQRIRKAVLFLQEQRGLSLQKVGELVGVANASSFSQIINGKRSVPKAMPVKLCNLDDRINFDYLYGRSDELILSPERQSQKECKENAKSEDVTIPSELVQMFSDLSSTIKIQQETIAILVNKINQ